MRILVLGNGFDLDHGLPTRYVDFLNFCNCITNTTGDAEETYVEKLSDIQKGYYEKLKVNEILKQKFLGLLQKCTCELFQLWSRAFR